MERELGSETHDGPVRRGQHNIRLPVGRLQSDTRVHRRLHILVDAVQGSEPDAERGAVPQADRWLVITVFVLNTDLHPLSIPPPTLQCGRNYRSERDKYPFLYIYIYTRAFYLHLFIENFPNENSPQTSPPP